MASDFDKEELQRAPETPLFSPHASAFGWGGTYSQQRSTPNGNVTIRPRHIPSRFFSATPARASLHNEPRPFCSTTSAEYQSRQQQQGQQQVVNVRNTTTTPPEVPNEVDIFTNNRSVHSAHSAGMPSLQRLPSSHQDRNIP